MIIMMGQITAIKDNGFLAVSSLVVLICESHIRMCRKVPLLSLDSLILSIDNTWPLLVSDHPPMLINAGVNIKVYVFDIKGNYRQFESWHE